MRKELEAQLNEFLTVGVGLGLANIRMAIQQLSNSSELSVPIETSFGLFRIMQELSAIETRSLSLQRDLAYETRPEVASERPHHRVSSRRQVKAELLSVV